MDLRKGVQGEQSMVAAELRVIREDSPMTEAELEGLVSRLSGVISFAREQSGQPPRSMRAALRAAAKDPTRSAGSPAADHSGCTKEAAGKFPPLQIVLLDQKLGTKSRRDERLKLLSVPVWQGASAEPAGKSVGGVKWPLADLLPNIEKLRARNRPSWNGRSRCCGMSRLCDSMPPGTMACRRRGWPTSRAAAAGPGHRQSVRLFGGRDDGPYRQRFGSRKRQGPRPGRALQCDHP